MTVATVLRSFQTYFVSNNLFSDARNISIVKTFLVFTIRILVTFALNFCSTMSAKSGHHNVLISASVIYLIASF